MALSLSNSSNSANAVQASEQSNTHPNPTGSMLRALMLLVGAVGCGVLASVSWMLDKNESGFVLLDREKVVSQVPTVVVLLMLGMIAVGGVGLLMALFKDTRLRASIGWCFNWCKRYPKTAIVILAVITFGAFDLYEVMVNADARRNNRDMPNKFRAFMVREDMKAWLLMSSTLMTALAMLAISPCVMRWSKRADCVTELADLTGKANGSRSKLCLAIAIIMPIVLGGLMSRVALDGVPHFSDSLTYQFQGRMMANGHLSVENIEHPELFIGSLFLVTDQQHEDDAGKMHHDGDRLFGKYPIGWPAVLGSFDAAGIGFLANATLASLAALLTGLLAAQFTTKRVAVLAALIFATMPWVWFNGAHFASHVAVTVTLIGFLWLYLSCWRVMSDEQAFGKAGIRAVCAGLFLGAAVLVRPFDAAMFALPAVLLTVWLLIRQPKVWLPLGVLIAVGAMVGVGIYLWANVMTTGDMKVSPYNLEGRWQADWDASIKSVAWRFQFQWAELNARAPGWGFGGMTAAVLGLIVAMRGGVYRGRNAWSLGLVIASTGLFFATAPLFLFTNVWWGPRWLMPATPLLAILIAEFISSILQSARLENEPEDVESSHKEPVAGVKPSINRREHTRLASQFGLAILGAGFLVGLLVAYPGQWFVHQIAPPHNVSDGAYRTVQQMGLTNAVVAMPISGHSVAPLDARAGMVFMTVPFERNSVIFVRAVPNWQRKASKCFPDRQLYQLIADEKKNQGFMIQKADLSSASKGKSDNSDTKAAHSPNNSE
jgi:hypothetical protein